MTAMDGIRTIEADVAVVGAGAAGARAALAAAEAGARVALLSKGPLARSGITITAAGGMQALLHPDDSPEKYVADVLACGYDLADANLVRVLAEDSPARIADLERYGAAFQRQAGGGYDLRRFPGHSVPRNVFIRGGGSGLIGTLRNACLANPGIAVHEDFYAAGLVPRADGSPAPAGVVGLDLKSGEICFVGAGAVVLATGGCQRLWEINDCPADATGDGLAMAYRAGAELIDMEMVLFYPSVIVWPPSLRGAFVHYEFLAPEFLDGEILDRDGRPVLPKPLPVRDVAMRLMAEAIAAGRGGEHGGLFWWAGEGPKSAAGQAALNTAQYKYIRQHGVEPLTDKIEVAPGAHYLLGGIGIDAQGATSVPGLFATPECAGNIDGANRLAGSALMATQVFGCRAGQAAQAWALAHGAAPPEREELAAEVGRLKGKVAKEAAGGGETAAESASLTEVRSYLRAAVQQGAGVRRDAAGLGALLRAVAEAEEALAWLKVPDIRVYNQQLVDLLELEAACTVARLVAGSALKREESRGHHFRADFPARDDGQWLRHTTVRRGETGPEFGSRPVIR